MFRCPLCLSKFDNYLPFPQANYVNWAENGFKYLPKDFETFNFRQATCPICKANDSYRLYALYLRKKLARNPRLKFFLDFAPVPVLSKLIQSFPNLTYRSADLNDPSADDKVDITKMDLYKTGSIDILLCSHVLEHVEDDLKAAQELFRILRPGGWGIIMVPIVLDLQANYENWSATSEVDRWKHFGQGDHVRLYSKKGFVANLKHAGFKVKQLEVEYFGTETFKKSGLAPRSILYVVEK